MNNLTEKTIGFVGGGNMGEAIFSGLISSGAVRAEHICVSDVSQARLNEIVARYGVRVFKNDPANNLGAAEMAKDCDIVFLAIKPQYARDVIKVVGSHLTRRQLLVSIVGGLPLAQIEEFIKSPVIRVMPNMPMTVREGIAGIAAGSACTNLHVELATEIFGHLGKTFVLPENLIDPLTGISGCGPAYAYIFIEAMADGGVKSGLPRELAVQVAAQTLLGSAKMALETDKHSGRLKDEVCSPGGSTIAGVHSLEKGGFRAAVIDAVEAGVNRMTEIGKKS